MTYNFSPLYRDFPDLIGEVIVPMQGGLINDTFAVGERLVLQRLHAIFDRRVNADIAALTPWLVAANVPVPELVRTSTGELDVELDSGALAGVWRLMRRVPGVLCARVETLAHARAAGGAIAGFHAALLGVRHEFAFTRPGAHDTDAHMARLTSAIEAHPEHRLYEEVLPIANELLERWSRASAARTALPERIVHGDPKIANLLFDADASTPRVSAVLDLDTMAWSTLEVEMGDAMRSWCSVSTESAPSASFDLERFEAASAGYVERAAPWLTPDELLAFGLGTERICLELAARFARDALEEAYFGWDPAAAPSRGAHNLLRAANQLALAQSVNAQQDDIGRVLGGLAERLARGD